MANGMSGWMRVDVDFGAPLCTFLVPLRLLMGSWLPRALNHPSPELQAKVIADYVVDYRPSLVGCTVVGYAASSFSWFRILVTHPSLPRMKMGESTEERLELCPGCGNPLSCVKQWLRNLDGCEVCSEVCAGGSLPQSDQDNGGRQPQREAGEGADR